MSVLPDHMLVELLNRADDLLTIKIPVAENSSVNLWTRKQYALTEVRPGSIDVHLDLDLIVTEQGYRQNVYSPYPETRRISIQHLPYRLHQGAFVLGATREYLMLGEALCADIVGLSSVARAGVIIESAGFIDPGWKGQLTLEISNQSPKPVMLTSGMRIAQIRVQRMAGPAHLPYELRLDSHYQGSIGPIESREYP